LRKIINFLRGGMNPMMGCVSSDVAGAALGCFTDEPVPDFSTPADSSVFAWVADDAGDCGVVACVGADGFAGAFAAAIGGDAGAG
jgi:hypothetical protein